MLLKSEAADEEFRENFSRICDATKAVIASKGGEASYLGLYWLCKHADGECHANWWRLLFGNLRHMAQHNGGKSKVWIKRLGA